MSGDLGPRVAILASQKFVTQFPDVDLLLVGNEAQLHTAQHFENKIFIFSFTVDKFCVYRYLPLSQLGDDKKS